MGTAEALRLMNEGDVRTVEAVGEKVEEIALLVDQIAVRMKDGGRLIYLGTGTSGRLGVLDASEIPPTFGLEPERVVGIIAGGPAALSRSVEGLEDVREAGAEAIASIALRKGDTVILLSASGNTPFTLGAAEEAASNGSLTACITCSRDGALAGLVKIPIVIETGPEFIAGSTRLRAGTAQKLVLNMISTMTMVRLGYTSGNRMTNLSPANQKLAERAKRIVAAETGLPDDAAGDLIRICGGDHRVALVKHKTGKTVDESRAALENTGFVIADAVQLLSELDK